MGHPITPAITPRQWYDYFKGLLAQPLARLRMSCMGPMPRPRGTVIVPKADVKHV
jgi:uncharacterized protein YjeT (DUF2065 family)